MMRTRKLISFDWALKHLFRSKANFDVLEGFLSELLKDDIKIVEILESEGNKTDESDKFNRVDLKVKNKQSDIIIVEIQYDRELDYFQRIFYSTSKAICEHMREEHVYQEVIKVISINILFFNIGKGEDYVYQGITQFIGTHHHDELALTGAQKTLFNRHKPQDIFPEYYLIRVNKFNDITKDALDEWIYFLKNEEIKANFQAKGLKRAKEILDVMKLSEQERQAYSHHLQNRSYQASMYHSTYVAGCIEGEQRALAQSIKQGIEQGEIKKAQETILEIADIKFCAVPPEVKQTVDLTTDLTRLKEMLHQVIRLPSIEAYQQWLKDSA